MAKNNSRRQEAAWRMNKWPRKTDMLKYHSKKCSITLILYKIKPNVRIWAHIKLTIYPVHGNITEIANS